MSEPDAIAEIFHAEGYRGVPGLAKKTPADAGGTTNLFGVTLRTYAGWLGKDLAKLDAGELQKLEADLEDMQEAEARLILRDVFVKPAGLDRITNSWVLAEVLDMAWHSGPGNAVRALQRAIGVADDGVIGAVTLSGIPASDEGGKKLARYFLAERMEFIGRWAAGDMSDRDKNGVPDRLQMTPGILNRIGRHMRRVA